MKFLSDLLRLLKLKRSGGENDENNNEGDAQPAQAKQSNVSAPKSKRGRLISAAVAVVVLSAAAAGALLVFSGGQGEPYPPSASANAWVPLSDADRALFQAVRNGSAEDVRRRLREGADAHALDEKGVTPLKAAIALGRGDAIHEFIEADRNASAAEWPFLLVYAVVHNRPEAVKEITRLPIGLNVTDKNGCTPLLYAIERGSLHVIRELLNAGADVGARGRDGASPLVAAVMRGRHDIVAELLKAGADLKVRAPSGETVMDIARQRNRDAIVALLLEAETPTEDTYEEYMKLPPENGDTPALWTSARTDQSGRQPSPRQDTR